MSHFRDLILAALVAGATAGFVLFAVQHLTIVPLIEQAELYEDAAPAHAGHDPAHEEADQGWQPAAGLQRTGLTAIATMLSGIGFAAVLLSAIMLSGARIDPWRGLLWGLAGFACFVLAPALGLPPKPPGAAVGDLAARQAWWLSTVVATAVGLWLLIRPGTDWRTRILGAVVLLTPHLIGAPPPDGEDVTPPALVRDFALLSVATNLLFWLVLGVVIGWMRERTTRGRAAASV
jgi:cobalt transporter subunit CbtA